MVFCTKCGEKAGEEDDFCRQCGAPQTRDFRKKTRTRKEKIPTQQDSSNKPFSLLAKAVVYDRFWAQGLDEDLKKKQANDPRTFYHSIDHITGKQRITIKNVDQAEILTQVLAADLTQQEIKQLRDLLDHYAKNYREVQELANGISDAFEGDDHSR